MGWNENGTYWVARRHTQCRYQHNIAIVREDIKFATYELVVPTPSVQCNEACRPRFCRCSYPHKQPTDTLPHQHPFAVYQTKRNWGKGRLSSISRERERVGLAFEGVVPVGVSEPVSLGIVAKDDVRVQERPRGKREHERRVDPGVSG